MVTTDGRLTNDTNTQDLTVILYEDKVIESIVEYFKAWEFFLFRPLHQFHPDTTQTHYNAIQALQDHVKALLLLCKGPRRTGLFIDSLKAHVGGDEKQLVQCTLEMLLAGTETSSVTLYYAVLKLAEDSSGHSSLQDRLFLDFAKGRAELFSTARDASVRWTKLMECSPEDKISPLMHDINYLTGKKSELCHAFLYEVLRTKPVGPVVIRQALTDDVVMGSDGRSFPVSKGTGVIIHLARMHMDGGVFPAPDCFTPERFMGEEKYKGRFYPFGHGPKGCVGQFLAMVEMKAVLWVFIPQFKMEPREQKSCSLRDLKTKWEIANQPRDPPTIVLRPRKLSIYVSGACSTGKTTLCEKLFFSQ